jgi:hypothetical protein
MYTTHGLMTAADLADHEELTDTGNVSVDLDALTEEQAADACPLCADALGDHDWVRAARASGDVVSCDRYPEG